MEELKKTQRVLGKKLEGSPHEILLVLDATIGQNAIEQTRQFNNAIGISGIALTKLDGSSKGGVIVGIANEFEIPIRYIGIGEDMDDLQPFLAKGFVDALFLDN
jgi:fused signal recognition particle receptor